MLHLAEKAFWPAPIPFPVMHVDTGHNFHEVIEFRDRRSPSSACGSSSRRSRIDRQRPRRRRHRPGRVAQPLADDDAARRDRGARFDAVIGGARRDEEKARAKERFFSLPRRVRPVGPEEPAARAVEPLQRPPPQGRAHPRVPAVELDRARHLAVHRRRADRAAVDLLRAPARGVPARRHADGRHRTSRARRGRGAVRGDGALPHRRRRDVHRRGRVEAPPRSTRSSPRSRRPGSPNAAPPAPTTSSPKRRWKTASARATSRWSCSGSRPPGLGRRRQEHAHRAAALRLEADLRGPARGDRAHDAAARRRGH